MWGSGFKVQGVGVWGRVHGLGLLRRGPDPAVPQTPNPRTDVHCRANMAHIRHSRPVSGLGFRIKVKANKSLKLFK